MKPLSCINYSYRSPPNLTYILFATFFVLSHVSCYINTKYQIRDLEHTGNPFLLEVQSWTLFPTAIPFVSSFCGLKIFMGANGFTDGQSFSYHKIYTNLPPHSSIRFTVAYEAYGYWGNINTDYFKILLDNQDVGGWTWKYDTDNFLDCSTFGTMRKYVQVYGVSSHSADSLTFKIVTVAKGTGTQIIVGGFRDVNLSFANAPVPSSYFCGISPTNLLVNECQCAEGTYKDGTCKSCHENCAACFGGTAQDCYSCRQGKYFDGTECISCDVACSTCYGTRNDQCVSCATGYEWFNSNKCVTTDVCDVVRSIMGSCNSPCNANQILYWNKTCSTTCPFPLQTITLPEVPVCINPCPKSPDAILDIDGVCKECKSLSVEYIKSSGNGHQYRLQLSPPSCDIGQDIVSNHLKLTRQVQEGPFPPFSFQVMKSDVGFYTIKLALEESLMQESILDAKLAHMSGEMIVPKKLVPSAIEEQLSEAIPAVQGTITAIMIVSFLGQLALGASASLWSLLSFQGFVALFRYINIEYPSRLELLLSALSGSIWDYIPNPVAALTGSLYEKIQGDVINLNIGQSLPPKFRKYEITSFFIESAGTTIIISLLTITILGVVLSLKNTKNLQGNTILRTMKVTLRWNMIARSLLENAVSLGLATCLQLRAVNFEGGAYLVICFLFAIVSLVYIVTMSVFLINKLHIRTPEYLDQRPVRKVLGTLYEGIKLKNDTSKYYFVLITMRSLLLVGLISFMEETPLLQVVPLIFCNIGLVYCMFTEISYEDPKLNIINRIKEVGLLFAEILILLLYRETNSEAYYVIIGDFIVSILGCIFFIEGCYIIGSQIKEIKTIKAQIVKLCSIIKSAFDAEGRRRRRLKQLHNRMKRINAVNINVSTNIPIN